MRRVRVAGAIEVARSTRRSTPESRDGILGNCDVHTPGITPEVPSDLKRRAVASILPSQGGHALMTQILLLLHITFFIAAIIVSYGPLLLLRLAYATGEVANLRGLTVVHSRLGPLTFVIYVLGGSFGGLTALAVGFDLLAPWLVIAYVAFAIAVLLGVTENRTWPLRLAEAVQRTPDGPLTPEIRALFLNRTTLAVLAIDVVWLPVMIFDMVIKPFS
jgi:hypothetical protein